MKKKDVVNKICLRSGDIIYFLHIPKTAGTTFFSLLSKRFSPEQVFNPSINEPEKIKEVSYESWLKTRLFRSHLGYGVYKYLPRKPIMVTFLREPVDRVISHYRHILRVPNHYLHASFIQNKISLLEFVEKHAQAQNQHVKHLVGYQFRQKEINKIDDGDKLCIAKLRLDEVAFFGLKEKFKESLQLFQSVFSWNKLKIEKFENVAPVSDQIEITTEVLDKIRKYNQLDLALYKYAEEKFESQIVNIG